MDNLKPLKMKFMAKFVPYDVLLCYNREIYTARGDDNNMAMSTVSSCEKLDNVRPCVGAQYSFQMPKNFYFFYFYFYLASPQGQGHHNSTSELLWACIT